MNPGELSNCLQEKIMTIIFFNPSRWVDLDWWVCEHFEKSDRRRAVPWW